MKNQLQIANEALTQAVTTLEAAASERDQMIESITAFSNHVDTLYKAMSNTNNSLVSNFECDAFCKSALDEIDKANLSRAQMQLLQMHEMRFQFNA